VLPKGDPEDTAVLRDFVTAVLSVEPNATPVNPWRSTKQATPWCGRSSRTRG